MINITNIDEKKVSEIQEVLVEERLTMTMGYSKGVYQCILRPQYHAKTNVILGRADTYIGAMDKAFKKVGDIAV